MRKSNILSKKEKNLLTLSQRKGFKELVLKSPTLQHRILSLAQTLFAVSKILIECEATSERGLTTMSRDEFDAVNISLDAGIALCRDSKKLPRPSQD